MFQRLKTKNSKKSIFKDRPNANNSSRSPGVNSSVVKGNEKSRLVRCRHCGWICDLERDVNLKDGSFAGFGINQGAQLTAGTSIGDTRTPQAGTISTSADQYFDREVLGGCPCCGSFVYDPRQPIISWPTGG